ncbi:aminoglycoside phosphotransferase family protein [Actinacidiphila alni]|uniref:aminoglycoside phosphotransferase family protein n=1 Tax=Actinacidiphila alni TaxID=380248 RepID=UPI0033EE9E8C
METDLVEGPLKGYHHQTYAVRLDPASPFAKDFGRLKLREPREGVYWYDMRWFPSEDLVLRLLDEHYRDRLPHIPHVRNLNVQGQWTAFLGFIEGVTLDRVPGSRGARVAEKYVGQIVELFRSLVAVDPRTLETFGGPFPCGCDQHETIGPQPTRAAVKGGSTAFLRGLTHFTVRHAYEDRQRASLHDLLTELGVPRGALAAFERRRPQLTDRPRALLHGDLHRKNFVVDPDGALWTIDWELALIGDPLYDLATHLHLMAYPEDQEEDLIGRWEKAVGEDAAAGAREDLPHYRAYKRVQSLCTDVIRAATRLLESPDVPGTREAYTRLRGTSALVGKVLDAVLEPLGVDRAPSRPAVEGVFHDWWRQAREAAHGGTPATTHSGQGSSGP